MPETKPQNYANHAKFDPPYHFVLVPIVLINVILSVIALVRNPNLETGWIVVLSFGAVLAVLKLRTFALKAQDRVIRLEERMRLNQILPDSQRSRIGDLTESQLIALRFAPDSELPALVDRCLKEQLKNAEIKKAIVNWRPDHYRV